MTDQEELSERRQLDRETLLASTKGVNLDWVAFFVKQYLNELRKSPTAAKQAKVHAKLMYWRERVSTEGETALKVSWNECFEYAGGDSRDLIPL